LNLRPGKAKWSDQDRNDWLRKNVLLFQERSLPVMIEHRSRLRPEVTEGLVRNRMTCLFPEMQGFSYPCSFFLSYCLCRSKYILLWKILKKHLY
jgi:hypothetical protein